MFKGFEKTTSKENARKTSTNQMVCLSISKMRFSP
jgi:hypothetical protein